MTYELCTLFDAAYLPRGLALYHSLLATGADFRLRVFCMDDETYAVLSRLDLDHLTPIELTELEGHDSELLDVKPTRSQVEYYWTATPSVCLYCLETEPELESITYLDADLSFFSSPAPIYDELGQDSVLIVPHRFAPAWEADVETSGVYNVACMVFRRSDDGLEALRWWRDRCIEWCYARVEDGKFGDQKYLDDWPQRFRGVHVLEHPGAGLAPWNVTRYRLSAGDPVTVDGAPLIFFHFHALRLHSGLDALARTRLVPPPYHRSNGSHPLVWSSHYPVAPLERRLIWKPYVRRLSDAVAEVRQVEPLFDAGFVRERVTAVAAATARRVVRRLVRLARRLDPDRLPFIGLRRHRGSWRSTRVARQMAELAEEELSHPESVPPYRAFLEAIGVLVDEYPLSNLARLLDFGCGTGHYSELLERYFPGRFAYVGCDYAPEMVAAARERWPGREFVVNNVLANRLDLNSFDVICAGALIDVLADYGRALDVLLGSRALYVLLHRQRITSGLSRVEVAAGYQGQRTHRVRLRLDDLEAVAARHGRAIERSFPVADDIHTFLIVRRSGA